MTAEIDIIAEREQAILAPYAMHSGDSRGRRHPEAPHPYRGPYQRDRDRILHSAAFRRLSQKTQVFAGEMGDYHRTRLTHTLEVASIARTIARALRLNEDLVEALAFAHDMGHPPFGHAGEDVLDECLREVGGFNHNAQAVRICELLESSYREYPGLNLTFEVLEGQRQRASKRHHCKYGVDSGERIASPLLEVQVVDAADSIAYDAHDADDALELGLLRADQLFEVPLWSEARDRVTHRSSALSERQSLRAIVHEIIDWQVSDLIEQAQQSLSKGELATIDDVCRAPVVICPSEDFVQKKANLERFLFDKVYRHPQLLAKREHAKSAIRDMYGALLNQPEKLPHKFQLIAKAENLPRAIGDYLAGMTDRFAFEEHRRLLNI